MKTLQKVLVILLIAMFVFALVPVNTANAIDWETEVWQPMSSNEANVDTKAVSEFTSLANTILTFLQILSGITAVVMIAITGFRYIVETPEVKGELKKNMVPIVIGILLVFFAVSIAKFFLGIAKK